MKKYILPIVLVLLSILSADAQESYSRYRQSLQKTGFRGIGIGAGVYFPKADYLTDQLDFDFGWKNLSPAAMFGQEFWLYKPIAARLAIGYQRSKGEQTIDDFVETYSLTTLPISADLMLFTTQASRFSRNPMPSYYFGLGVEYIILNILYSSNNPELGEQKLSGSPIAAHALAGIEYPLGDRLRIGLEGQWVFGNYSQPWEITENNSYLETISISGPKAFLTVKYVFIDYIPRATKGYPRRR